MEDPHDCYSCGERMDNEVCPKSQFACGHHCNHTWTHDICHWCGAEFGDVDDPNFGIPKAA